MCNRVLVLALLCGGGMWCQSITGAGAMYGGAAVGAVLTYDINVDSVAGNDVTGTGTSTYPFRTLTKLQTILTTGKSVGLKRGSHWREELSTQGRGWTYLTFGAYGTGPKPMIDGSDIISGTDEWGQAGAVTWTLGSGTTWQADVTSEASSAGASYINMYRDNVRVTRVANQVTCESTVFSFWPSSDDNGTQRIYYNSGSASSPGIDGHLYEYNSRNASINDDAGVGTALSHITLRGLAARRNKGNNGSIDVGRYATLIDVQADDGTKHNVLIGCAGTITGLSVHNAWYGGQGSDMLIIYDGKSIGVGGSVAGFTATMDTYDVTVQAVYGHSDTGGLGLGLWIYRDFVITNLGSSVDGPWSSLTNLTANGSGGIVASTTQATVTNATLTAMPVGRQAFSAAWATTISIDGLTATCNANNGCISLSVSGGSLSITNSTIGNQSSGDADIWAASGVTLASLSITHTMFLQPAAKYVRLYNAPLSVIFDYNTYHYSATGARIMWLSGPSPQYDFSASGWATWTALGYDAHSLMTTP